MLPFIVHDPFMWLSTLALALLIDLVIGEFPEKVHPTVWMGRLIDSLKRFMRSSDRSKAKLNGVLLSLSVILSFSISTYLILYLTWRYLGPLVAMILAATLLKASFAFKSMWKFTTPIADAIKVGEYRRAKALLRHVVRRDTEKLNEQQTVSAAVETIAEGTVDGATAPLFYYALLGVPGAIAYRAINTLDSMVGYKDIEHIHLGWFSAKLDTIANFIPARLTSIMMILASWLLRKDWRNAWRILKRDCRRLESLNAGYPMSAMAGALNVRLEKPNFYRLGDDERPLSYGHIFDALWIMSLSIYLFILIIVVPLMILIWSIW
ncbi:MAG: cobalamin biosynthesis protein [Nitrososphaerota archaeon]|nr:cobalamin biosynthesis protein [Nitrososphaerota archaeon]